MEAISERPPHIPETPLLSAASGQKGNKRQGQSSAKKVASSEKGDDNDVVSPT